MHLPESWCLKFERPVSFVHPLNVLRGTGTLADASSICDVKWSCTYLILKPHWLDLFSAKLHFFFFLYTLRLEATGTLGV